jgi:hypothetical protein
LSLGLLRHRSYMPHAALYVSAGGAPFSPADLSPNIWIDPSDLSTVYQERTGTPPSTASAVGDVVGSILNKGSIGGYMRAPSDAARMILRQNGSGKYYLEADGSDDRYTVSWTNATGARSSTIGVQSTAAWVMSKDSNGTANTDGEIFGSDLYVGGATDRLYRSLSVSAASPGAVVSTLGGPGVTPAAWRNSVSLTVSDFGGRVYGATILGVLSNAASAAGAAHYYGYVSCFTTLSSGNRASLETWMAGQMGISI